jgi:hypothetical protein
MENTNIAQYVVYLIYWPPFSRQKLEAVSRGCTGLYTLCKEKEKISLCISFFIYVLNGICLF